MSQKPNDTRRDFLKKTSFLTAGIALSGGLNIVRSAHAAGSDEMKACLIGCGGRGTGAAHNLLGSVEGVKIVAVADAFEDRAKGAAKDLHKNYPDKVDLPDDRIFTGFDAYKQALDCGVDLVLLATPPGFRPMHYAAAIAAGKHVFMEKPCCVDAPGYRSLQATNKSADEKNLKVVVGLQRRHQRAYLRGIQKIHDGELGDITFMHAYWNQGAIWVRPRRPEMTEMEYQMRNWYHFVWLCGDHIVEQHVHNLDICNWAISHKLGVKDAHPVTAVGMGSCHLRDNRGIGQIYDNHTVEFTYADGTKLFSQCRQQDGTWESVSEHIHCTKGKSIWNSRTTRGGRNPYDQEHIDLIEAIRKNEPLNEGWHAAASCFTAVLGRMATYSGQEVKWDDAVQYGPAEMPADFRYAWDANPPAMPDKDGNYPMAVPGQYQAYIVPKT
jgi:myo-inositol 2-dehydrogenase / D-chiro-inositol 1-dehydrogenase